MTEAAFAFEKLKVYKQAKELVRWVYAATGRFPAEEKYGIASQIRRASVSVVSNLAEGSARTSRKDQAHFTQLAYSSLMEVACQLDLARDLGFLSREDLESARIDIVAVARSLSGLRKAQTRESEGR